ncbi:hypothetical protein [Streptomyces sp. NPDC059788]|uniref:hypothetical protein n=1 Tax=Streptomyces sp. NPDC059788 TaxID=3346948 RepID=UPI00364DE1CF
MALVCAVVPLAAIGMTGCSVDAKSAEPAVKTFPFEGRTLNVKSHEIPADLVATDRKDIKVTRWFDAKSGKKTLRWELKGDTLDLQAGCRGLAICDARFEVEVPRGVAVLRDGAKTDLRGQDGEQKQPQGRNGQDRNQQARNQQARTRQDRNRAVTTDHLDTTDHPHTKDHPRT